MNTELTRIKINDNTYLKVEQIKSGADYPAELAIFLESADGRFIQDIAQVNQTYFCRVNRVQVQDSITVRVWGNCTDENYTHKDIIHIYNEDED